MNLGERIEPVAPIFNPTREDRIRALDYPNAIEDVLLGLVNDGASEISPAKTGFRMCLKISEKVKKSSVQRLQVRLRADAIILKLTPPQSSLANQLREIEDLSARERGGKIRLRVGYGDVDATVRAIRILRAFVSRQRR